MTKKCAGQSTREHPKKLEIACVKGPILTALSPDIDQFIEDQASRGIAILLERIIREGCSHDEVASFLQRADRHLPKLAKTLAKALDKAGELGPLVTSKATGSQAPARQTATVERPPGERVEMSVIMAPAPWRERAA